MESRRQFPRVKTTIACRPAGLGKRLQRPRLPADLSLGGAKIRLDEPAEPGARLDLDLFMPDGELLSCPAELVWIEPLQDGPPARFDAGVRFGELAPQDRQRLERALGSAGRGLPGQRR